MAAIKIAGAFCLLSLVSLWSPNAAGQDTDQIVRELCGKRVALLGESPVHGFGKTLQFKVEVVRRLVDECRFGAFFIESGVYDFLNIQKKLKSSEPVTQPMVAAAIGGLWASREVEPLIPYLLDKARTGVVILGGLDDQLGRGTYAQQRLPADLVQSLQGDARSRCLAILQRHTLWQYTADAPYAPNAKGLIVGCLAEIKVNLSRAQTRDVPFREYDLAMIASLERNFDRDFTQGASTGPDLTIQTINARDHSMYLNFQWLMSRLPANRKVIVWTATTHAAKDLSGVAGQERMVPLGSYIHREFANRAFALGFSAYSGSYGMARQPARPLSAAPPLSLEGLAFAKDAAETHYFTVAQLRDLGTVSARPTGPDFKSARWDLVLDGLVVFREDHPPNWLIER